MKFSDQEALEIDTQESKYGLENPIFLSKQYVATEKMSENGMGLTSFSNTISPRHVSFNINGEVIHQNSHSN